MDYLVYPNFPPPENTYLTPSWVFLSDQFISEQLIRNANVSQLEAMLQDLQTHQYCLNQTADLTPAPSALSCTTTDLTTTRSEKETKSASLLSSRWSSLIWSLWTSCKRPSVEKTGSEAVEDKGGLTHEKDTSKARDPHKFRGK